MLILASRDVFQWDASDATFDLGGQNVLRTFEMAIRHYRRTTRTERERENFLSPDLFSLTFKNIVVSLLRGRSPPCPPIDPSQRPSLSVRR